MRKQSSLLSKLAAGTVILAAAFAPLVAFADSLWRDDGPRAMVADKRAFAVGDLLTIVVQETSSATKANSTATARKSSVDSSISTFLYPPSTAGSAVSKFLTKGGAYPAMKFSGANTFDGSGKINNSEAITTRISVRVVDAMPNGNLLIEGVRRTSFAGEQQDIVLRGIVRQDDIASDNSVLSYNVADATVSFKSRGTVTDNTRKGWFSTIWEKLSPF